MQLERRLLIELAGTQVPVCSAEDIILQKLRWFEQGGRVSDRQWRDLLGVVKVNHARLDREYLDHHAQAAGVADLLVKLLDAAEAG